MTRRSTAGAPASLGGQDRPGEADALRFRAKAEKEAAELQGLGQAARIRSEVDGAGGFTNYVALLNAQAKLRWNGQTPRFMIGGDKGGPNFLLPIPESEITGVQPAATATTTAAPAKR